MDGASSAAARAAKKGEQTSKSNKKTPGHTHAGNDPGHPHGGHESGDAHGGSKYTNKDETPAPAKRAPHIKVDGRGEMYRRCLLRDMVWYEERVCEAKDYIAADFGFTEIPRKSELKKVLTDILKKLLSAERVMLKLVKRSQSIHIADSTKERCKELVAQVASDIGDTGALVAFCLTFCAKTDSAYCDELMQHVSTLQYRGIPVVSKLVHQMLYHAHVKQASLYDMAAWQTWDILLSTL